MKNPLIDWLISDEGDIVLDSTVLVDDNITDCDVLDDQEKDERTGLNLYFLTCIAWALSKKISTKSVWNCKRELQWSKV